MNLDKLTEDYISYWDKRYKADQGGIVREVDKSQYEWANDQVMDITFDRPELLWDFVLAVLAKNPSDDVQEILAAGPLEDYLAKFGEKIISKVERRALKDPQFANLLGGIWQSSMSNEVWARVQKVWDRSGWDGN